MVAILRHVVLMNGPPHEALHFFFCILAHCNYLKSGIVPLKMVSHIAYVSDDDVDKPG
jgi:hypothetical protein